MDKHKFLAAIVDDEKIVCNRLKPIINKIGFSTDTFQNGTDFLSQMEKTPYNLIFLDRHLPDIDGMKILSEIYDHYQNVEIVMITGYGSIDSAVEAMKKSAFHYITKPFKLPQIRSVAENALEKLKLKAENFILKSKLDSYNFETAPIIGISPAMREVYEMIKKVAKVDCNVIIQGESGTGKELVAQALHRESNRCGKPFVSFNCAAFTEELILSELFGHEKGAFTGATSAKPGLLGSASGGTVFLDEIGEMPLSMQAKLLRAIQEKSIRRVGGTTPIKIDIRIIAASNKDLKKASMEDQFREDLYFRLNVVTIFLPRLMERKEDIPVLTSFFIKKYNEYFGKKIEGISDNAKEILNNYHFPGNVRELENIIQRGVALASGSTIFVKDLPQDIQELKFNLIQGQGLLTMDEVEKEHIIRVLQKAGGNKTLAAQILDIPRTTLWRKIKKFQITD